MAQRDFDYSITCDKCFDDPAGWSHTCAFIQFMDEQLLLRKREERLAAGDENSPSRVESSPVVPEERSGVV